MAENIGIVLWDTYWALVSSTDGHDYTLTGSAIPGSGALSLLHHQSLHLAVTLCLTLGSTFSRLAKDCLSPAFASLSDRARALALSALQLDEGEPCFRALPKIGHLTSAQYSAVLHSRDELRKCRVARQWGPKDEPMHHLCSPGFLLFLTWVGSPIVDPILDFLFVYSHSNTSFVEPWLDCPTPYVNHISFKAINDRVEALRNNAHYRTPAHKLSHLADQAAERLTTLLKTLFLAAGECINIPAVELFVDNVVQPPFPSVIATPTPQLPSTTTPLPATQVSSELPTCSSLPSYTPNFSPDNNPQWFRSASYHFGNLQFPVDIVARGDASAERTWHEYACNVLRARVICMQLSELQVISHLAQSFQRSDPHFAISEECRLHNSCTVVFWLTTLREFFFTNQQFRHNIELAWQQYRVGHAKDFNELVHHIRVYYQLVFLDYPTLPGKMTLHDFAWHLFEKMQHLLSPACKTDLARTVQLYIPLSGVLEQMQLHLRTQAMVSTTLELDPAHGFVSWCLKQLRFAKEVANTTRRYATLQEARTTIDYAQLSTRNAAPPLQPSAPATAAGRPRRTACLNSSKPASSEAPPVVQNTSSTHTPGDGLITRRSVPADVRESINRKGRPLPGPALRNISRRLVPWMDSLIAHELEHPGQPDTLHGLAQAYSDARKPPYRIATSPEACCQYLLKSHLVYTRPLCSLCPHDSTHGRDHFAADCPELKKYVPEALRVFLANPANAGKGFLAAEPGRPIPEAVMKPKRDRYDPKSATPTAPTDAHPQKRSRAANIR